MASFPPPLTHYFIERYSDPGDSVLDIFSGTGTAPLQACLDQRIGIGNDVSPEAYLLTNAKVDPPESHEFFSYLHALRARVEDKQATSSLDSEPYFDPDFLKDKLDLQLYYHKETLKQLLKVRTLLLGDLKSASPFLARNSRFCIALILGILHGDRPESLSLPLDRSKSLTSNHIRKMQKDHPGKYTSSRKDVIECAALKASKVFLHTPHTIKGLAYQKDATDFMLEEGSIDLVITSPPYYNAHTYPYDNRHRLWFLGYDYREIQRSMFQKANLSEYSSFISKCLMNVQKMLRDNSACVLVVGDIEMSFKGEKTMIKSGERIASEWSDSKNTEMNVDSVILDPIPLKSRRYIHVPVTQGIKVERIVVFHKGRPKVRNVSTDWKTRPSLENGPNWSSL